MLFAFRLMKKEPIVSGLALGVSASYCKSALEDLKKHTANSHQPLQQEEEPNPDLKFGFSPP